MRAVDFLVVPTLATLLLGAAGCSRTPPNAADAPVAASAPAYAPHETSGEDEPDRAARRDNSLGFEPWEPSYRRPRPRPEPPPVESGPYLVRVVDWASQELPTFGFQGRTYIMGTVGQRYRIMLRNPTSQRVEAVVSVDGLDAVDGEAGDYVRKRGYIIPAYGSTYVDGFRTSTDAVATFRFSSVRDSYAARKGSSREVGVIGVAFFRERYVPPPPPRPMRVPRYAPEDDGWHGGGGRYGDADRASPAPSAGATGRDEAQPRSAESSAPKRDRRGLGTEFGEERDSRVEYTRFVRADAASPSQITVVRYNDRAGLIALGVPLYADPPSRETELRETAEPFPVTPRFAQPPPRQ